MAGPVVGGVRDLNGTVNISSSLGQSESSSVHSKEIKIEQNCSSLEEIEKRNRVSIEKDKKIERGRMTMKNESASAKTAASILNLPWRSESALVDPCRLTQMKIILKHFKNKIMQLRQSKKIDVEAIQKKVQKIEYGLFTRALSLEEYRNPDTLEKRISEYDDMGDRITKGSELDDDTDSDEGTKETREEEEGITVKAREEENEDKMDVDSKEMKEVEGDAVSTASSTALTAHNSEESLPTAAVCVTSLRAEGALSTSDALLTVHTTTTAPASPPAASTAPHYLPSSSSSSSSSSASSSLPPLPPSPFLSTSSFDSDEFISSLPAPEDFVPAYTGPINQISRSSGAVCQVCT